MLRVLYTAGPGNAFATFRDWKEGRRDLITSHVAYSRQMLETCARHATAARITCTYKGDEEQNFGDFSIVRRPDLSEKRTGFSYHLSLYEKARQNIRDALDFQANVVIVSEDTNPIHYAPLRRRGVRIVQALHTRLWREDRAPSFLQRLRLRGFRKAYMTGETTVLSSSDVVSGQVEQLSGIHSAPIVEFLPLYDSDHYSGIPEPDVRAECLNILFIGRVEANKGAIDLIDIASRLSTGDVAFRFSICGVGGALDEMKRMVSERGLLDRFVFHGWCSRDALRRVMAECQVAIVPTRSDFIEGFNHVVVESILSGRPAVASSICPAVYYVGDAVEIVQADDLDGYVAVLQELSRDRNKLRRRAQACAASGRRFTDQSYSFGAALGEVFCALREGRPIQDRRILDADGDVSPRDRRSPRGRLRGYDEG